MKKVTAIILCIVLVCSIPFAAGAELSVDYFGGYYSNLGRIAHEADVEGIPEEPEWLIGDVTYDGTVDAQDALFVLSFAFIEDVFSLEEHETAKKYYYGFIDSCYHDFKHASYDYYHQNMYTYIYLYNAAIMADVTNDCRLNAEDALMILQYAVGKRTEFPRTDFSWSREKLMFFLWPDDYEYYKTVLDTGLGLYWSSQNAKVWPPEIES